LPATGRSPVPAFHSLCAHSSVYVHCTIQFTQQRTQNTLARVVAGNRTSGSHLATLSKLHWLPVHDRIKFKIATVTHKETDRQTERQTDTATHFIMPPPLWERGIIRGW